MCLSAGFSALSAAVLVGNAIPASGLATGPKLLCDGMINVKLREKDEQRATKV